MCAAVPDFHTKMSSCLAAVHEFYLNLASIIGQWMSEQQRLDASSVAGSLLSTARSLNEASLALGGLETGIHSDLEIAVASRIAKYLALDPSVSSLAKAQEFISSFRQEAASNCPCLHGSSCRSSCVCD